MVNTKIDPVSTSANDDKSLDNKGMTTYKNT